MMDFLIVVIGAGIGGARCHNGAVSARVQFYRRLGRDFLEWAQIGMGLR
jgi:hypothetical protein